MKITKTQLKQIIKEEIEKVLSEQDPEEEKEVQKQIALLISQGYDHQEAVAMA